MSAFLKRFGNLPTDIAAIEPEDGCPLEGYRTAYARALDS